MNCPFDALDSPSGLACFDKKRVQDPDNNSGDRRHKRMIKNRESAARSRARKQVCTSVFPGSWISIKRDVNIEKLSLYFLLQAYTNELELEVAHLMEENARLKRQQEQVR